MDMLPNKVGAMIFHLAYFSPIVQICDIIYSFAHLHQLGEYSQGTISSWCDSLVGIALHHYYRRHGLESCSEALFSKRSNSLFLYHQWEYNLNSIVNWEVENIFHLSIEIFRLFHTTHERKFERKRNAVFAWAMSQCTTV